MPDAPTPSASIVCCVESGPLESQSLRMIESLRRWGGWLAHAQVLAITPRLGPPLLRETHRRFKKLNVEHHRVYVPGPYIWYHTLNKPRACVAAMPFAKNDQIIWLDSDMLILGNPTDLLLAPAEDFAACSPDLTLSTTGPEDPNDPYWQRIAQILSIDLATLPWIVTEWYRSRIRLYFNGGVTVFRKSRRFAELHLQGCFDVLNARIASHTGAGIYFTEQIVPGLIVHKHAMKYRPVDHRFNYTMGAWLTDMYAPQDLRAGRLTHYHDCMSPQFWPTFLARLESEHPEVAAWLKPQGPLTDPTGPLTRLANKSLRALRSESRKRHLKRCQML